MELRNMDVTNVVYHNGQLIQQLTNRLPDKLNAYKTNAATDK